MSPRERYRAVQDRHVPESARRVAEDRVRDMIRVWVHHQTFSAALPGNAPKPNLLDLCVSAYLQGVDDTVQVSTDRGWMTTPNDASEVSNQ